MNSVEKCYRLEMKMRIVTEDRIEKNIYFVKNYKIVAGGRRGNAGLYCPS